MSKQFFDIFSSQQKDVLSQLHAFKNRGLFSGGTALAIQLGHRRSYDFDIFCPKPLSKKFLFQVKKHFKKIQILIDTSDELSFLSEQGIKISFVFYPFKNILNPISYKGLDMASWKDIALDKAYTIGRRGAWRDYIDIYFVLKNKFPLEKIISGSEKKFGDTFSNKLFLSQLSYFDDLKDFSIDLLIQEKITPDKLKKFFEGEIAKLTLVS